MTLRVLLDTNSLYENRWLSTDAMRTFAQLCQVGFIECFIPHVVVREITTQAEIHQSKQVSAINVAFKALRRYNLPPDQFQRLKAAVDDLELYKPDVLGRPARDFMTWCDTHRITHVPLSPDHGPRVLDAYFRGDDPFKTQKSREDFPDAYIYEIVKDLASMPLYVVCQDQNLAKACGRLANVTVFATSDLLLADAAVAPLIPQATSLLTGLAAAAAPDGAEPLTFNQVEQFKQALSSLDQRFFRLDQAMLPDLINELVDLSISSAIISTDDQKARIVAVSIRDMHFDFKSASYYGLGKFSLAFTAKGELALQHYFSHRYRSARDLRGDIIERTQVYKEDELVVAGFSTVITGRASFQIRSAALRGGKIVPEADMFTLDEIRSISLSDAESDKPMEARVLTSGIT